MHRHSARPLRRTCGIHLFSSGLYWGAAARFPDRMRRYKVSQNHLLSKVGGRSARFLTWVAVRWSWMDYFYSFACPKITIISGSLRIVSMGARNPRDGRQLFEPAAINVIR